MKLPETMTELLEQSKKCHNYDKYTPKDWEKIAKHLAATYSIKKAYVMLDSKHMRWCEEHTYEGFLSYINNRMMGNIDEQTVSAHLTEMMKDYENE